MRLGIDFGTTRTGVAVQDRGNYPLVHFNGPEGTTLDHFPTVVAEKRGQFVYGLEALAASRKPGWTVLRSFKRLLSNPNVNLGTSVIIGDSVVQLIDLLAGYLSALRTEAIAAVQLPDSETEVIEAIIATPANAHSTQRLVTLEAFRRAGFEVVGMMNEPSAAGVEFAYRHKKTLSAKRQKVAVYDLGGGTFDASLVDMTGQQHDIVASAGLAKLGGDDFDEILLKCVLEAAELDARQLSATSREQLSEHCRNLKEALHPNTSKILVELGAHIDQVDRTIAGLDEEATVTVRCADYYEACTPLVDRSIEVLDQVLLKGGAEPQLGDVAAVYVVGGASGLAIVGRRLREHYGKRVRRTQYASGATAMGLATALGEGFHVKERLHRNFGVFREAQDGDEVSFDSIIDGTTRLPEPGEAPKTFERTYRPMHNIGHFRFLECGWLDTAGTPCGDITPFKDLYFPFDPLLQANNGQLESQAVLRNQRPMGEIMERYEVDGSGIIFVTIRDTETGYEFQTKLS